jgi:Uma2 family endonuclease
MDVLVTQPLTFEEFLAWDDGSGRVFELLDGIPVPLSEPNANHDDLIERLCALIFLLINPNRSSLNNPQLAFDLVCF